jgi:hypothetical protein
LYILNKYLTIQFYANISADISAKHLSEYSMLHLLYLLAIPALSAAPGRYFPSFSMIAIIILILASRAIYETSKPVTPADDIPREVPAQTVESPDVTVVVFDLGEALSVLIDDEDTEILIDGGNDRDGRLLQKSVIARSVSDETAQAPIQKRCNHWIASLRSQ